MAKKESKLGKLKMPKDPGPEDMGLAMDEGMGEEGGGADEAEYATDISPEMGEDVGIDNHNADALTKASDDELIAEMKKRGLKADDIQGSSEGEQLEEPA